MARCEKQGIDKEIIRLYTCSNVANQALKDRRYIENLFNAFDHRVYIENDEVKGVVVFHAQEEAIVIVEVFFEAQCQYALIKTLLKVCKGFKKIIFRTDIENSKMVKFGASLCSSFYVDGYSMVFEKIRKCEE